MLLLRDEQSGVEIDISLGILAVEEEIVASAIVMPILGESVPVADPASLLIMKVLAGRPRDLIDAETIVTHNPDLDRERVETWVHAFTEGMDDPVYVNRLKRVWADSSPPKKSTGPRPEAEQSQCPNAKSSSLEPPAASARPSAAATAIPTTSA